jgi:hypothetical protein
VESASADMTDDRPLTVLERIRRFWKPAPGIDHPLDARERVDDRPASAYDELSRDAEHFVGDDFDPDDHRD